MKGTIHNKALIFLIIFQARIKYIKPAVTSNEAEFEVDDDIDFNHLARLYSKHVPTERPINVSLTSANFDARQ